MTLLILYVTIAIAVSFICSILEAVLLSITPTFIATSAEKNPAQAKRLKELKDDVDRPLAAILSLNTIAHTVGAAGAGAQAAFVFGDAAVAVFSAVLTFLILVLSEIIPKTLGAMYWQSFAPWLARLMPLLIWIMWPLVKMSQGITRLLAGGEGKYAVTRAEIIALADIGQRHGVIDKGDSRIVGNLLRFDSLRVTDIMTPRTVVFAWPQAASVADVLAEACRVPFSRIPIHGGSIDEVTGYILRTRVLEAALSQNEANTLAEFRRELLAVPQDMTLQDLFDALLENDHHIALVRDGFGGTAGLVTLEDLVETLLGMEIVDEADTVEDLRAFARSQWESRADRKVRPEHGAGVLDAPSAVVSS
jgi:CBS domain containing-hemolysin-like protein